MVGDIISERRARSSRNRWAASSRNDGRLHPESAIKGERAKQPYAIAMKDGAPFGIAGIWENWKDPWDGAWVRTFAILTTEANDLVAEIHNRMPVILSPTDYELGEDPDPRDLLRPFPALAMRIWQISTRVNKPENDDASIMDPVQEKAA